MAQNTQQSLEPSAATITIGELFIAVTERDQDVLTVTGPHDERFPIVAFDGKSLAVLQKWSQDAADKTGQAVSIISFTRNSLHETFRPDTTGGSKQ